MIYCRSLFFTVLQIRRVWCAFISYHYLLSIYTAKLQVFWSWYLPALHILITFLNILCKISQILSDWVWMKMKYQVLPQNVSKCNFVKTWKTCLDWNQLLAALGVSLGSLSCWILAQYHIFCMLTRFSCIHLPTNFENIPVCAGKKNKQKKKHHYCTFLSQDWMFRVMSVIFFSTSNSISSWSGGPMWPSQLLPHVYSLPLLQSYYGLPSRLEN